MSGVLVSGATTPVGIALVRRLREEGRPVLAVALESDDAAGVCLPEGVRYERVDLSRPRHVRRLLFGPCTSLGIDSVVHLAAHREAHRTGERVHRLNVGATRLMVRLAENHPTIRRFVHLSTAQVYRNHADQPDVLREDAPLELSPRAPQWVRDRVEADVTACTRMGLSDVSIAVLRCAEIFAPDMGSQLYDFLSSRVCVRPIGFDPMLDLLSLDDAARALHLALDHQAPGVFNIPGMDRLPLSEAIALHGRNDIPVPGPLVGPLYRLRSVLRGGDFRYDLNRARFHFNAVLDGDRARRILDYRPELGLDWPRKDR